MSGECAMNNPQGLHPSSGSLPEGGRQQRFRSRLRLPGIGRSIRVRNLAVVVSTALHLLILGVLAGADLAAPLPTPPALVEVEFVELPGARGGGGAPAQAPAGKPSPAAFAPDPRPVPNLAPSPKAQPAPPQTVSAAAVSTATASASAQAAQSASAGGQGSGGGSGGGQGSGAGTSVGSGTGQGGVAVDRMPTPLRQVKPRYPMAARRAGQTGQVLLRLFVDKEGAVREAAVVRAEPVGIFEDAALEAIRKWRFEPAVSRGAPVGVWMTLPVRFALEER